eukprot:5483830-Amphidinium_carterae.1
MNGQGSCGATQHHPTQPMQLNLSDLTPGLSEGQALIVSLPLKQKKSFACSTKALELPVTSRQRRLSASAWSLWPTSRITTVVFVKNCL